MQKIIYNKLSSLTKDFLSKNYLETHNNEIISILTKFADLSGLLFFFKSINFDEIQFDLLRKRILQQKEKKNKEKKKKASLNCKEKKFSDEIEFYEIDDEEENNNKDPFSDIDHESKTFLRIILNLSKYLPVSIKINKYGKLFINEMAFFLLQKGIANSDPHLMIDSLNLFTLIDSSIKLTENFRKLKKNGKLFEYNYN